MNPSDSMLTVHDFYLSTGNKQMIGTYIKEMSPANQHGVFQYFYSNGNTKAIYDYRYGIIHGELKRYYQNGNLKSLERFDLGTKIDTSWIYHENGQLNKVMVVNPEFSVENPSDKFKKSILIHSFSSSGEHYVKNGKGVHREFFLSGKPKTEITYENGFPHGKWIKYSGLKNKVSCEMTFKNGRFIKGEMYDNGKKDIFSSLTRKAYFPTGVQGLEMFIDEFTGSCEGGYKNEVIVLLNISTQGLVTYEQIISGNVSNCQYEEVQNLIRNMPSWKPAVVDGRYVEGSTTIKINFTR